MTDPAAATGRLGATVHVPAFAAHDGRRAVETRLVDGLPQIIAWNPATDRRRQVTFAPHGAETAALEPDGRHLWWFDAAGGTGRWMRVPFDGGTSRPALDGLPAGRMYGLAFDARDGIAAVGTGTGDTSRFWTGPPGGRARLVAEEPGWHHLADIAPGGRLLATAGPPEGPAAARIRTTDTGGILDTVPGRPGRALWPLEFRRDAAAPELLLVAEAGGRFTLALWREGEAVRTHDWLSFDTEISATWYGPGRTVLVQHDRAGRSRLLLVDLDRRTTTEVPTPPGTLIDHSSAPDGTVHCLWTRDGVPPRLLTCRPASPGHDAAFPLSGVVAGPGRRELWTRTPHGSVHTFLTTPPGQGPWPTLFLVHGGPRTHDRDAYDARTEALCRAGYAVARANYRGSTGYGPAWRDGFGHRVGLAQIEDLAAVRGHLVAAGISEPGRVGLCGYSWGGYLVLLAMGVQPHLWDAGLAVAPVADCVAAHRTTTPALRQLDERLYGGPPEQVPHRYLAASPLTYADRVRGPVFIAASADDEKCPPGQIERYLAALRRHRVPHEIRWTGGGHDPGRDPDGHAAAWTAMLRCADEALCAPHRRAGRTERPGRTPTAPVPGRR